MKLGNPTNTAEAAAKGRKISIDEADRFAKTALPIIASIQRSGVITLRGLAIALNNRGPHSAQWSMAGVERAQSALATLRDPLRHQVLLL